MPGHGAVSASWHVPLLRQETCKGRWAARAVTIARAQAPGLGSAGRRTWWQEPFVASCKIEKPSCPCKLESSGRRVVMIAEAS